MWLEMSRDEVHGGGDWAFTKCLWAPAHKEKVGTWRFWTLLKSVRAGDVVLHLRGKSKQAAFVGYSTADADGAETTERPPEPGRWAFAKSFLRVPLRDFVPFAEPISLDSIFAEKDAQLREYFYSNKEHGRRQKNPIFFVVQNKKLQCLNGAYLTEMTPNLAVLVFGMAIHGGDSQIPLAAASTKTKEQLRYLWVRVGQQDFSTQVRNNFGGRCCFPGCGVTERELLVGSHIARWADVDDLRGETSNGLCLCLMHDKAFEKGWFTLEHSPAYTNGPKH